jgi:hypothetical protein
VPVPGLVDRDARSAQSGSTSDQRPVARGTIEVLRRFHRHSAGEPKDSTAAGRLGEHFQTMPVAVQHRLVGRDVRRTTSNTAVQADVIRRMRVVDAVPQAQLRATAQKRWMIVQGLQQGWHLTIIPENQDNWGRPFSLPANGSQGIMDWMTFDEFHITSPQSVKHFFYTEKFIPLAASMWTRSKSAPWTDPDWYTANWLVTGWFKGNESTLKWLTDYVQARPGQERAEARAQKSEETFQANIWQLYQKWVKAGNPPTEYDHWQAELRAKFQGTDPEFREHVAQQANQG